MPKKYVLPHSLAAWEETTKRLTDPSFSLPVNDNCGEDQSGEDWIHLTQETWPDLSRLPRNMCNKRIAAFKNMLYVTKKVGATRCAQAVFTFPKGTKVPRARAAFKRARLLMKKVFVTWIAFLQISGDGFLHYHLFIVLPEPIAAGFRWDLYWDPLKGVRHFLFEPEEILEYRRACARNLTKNPYLLRLWALLRRELPGFGFGRRFPFQLTPIDSHWSCAEYQTKGLQGMARHRLPKKARAINYARNFPRPWGEIFQVVTPASCLRRRRFAAIGETFLVTDEEIAKRFGPRWGYWFLQMIEEMNLRHGEGWHLFPMPGRSRMIRRVAEHFGIRERLEPPHDTYGTAA
jgi:hypothetical protein